MRPLGRAVARAPGRGSFITQFYHNGPRIAFPCPLTKGVFRLRTNRFAVLVEIDGELQTAHLPNTGRLRELLVDGATIWLVSRPRPLRRTVWDLLLVEYAGQRVCVDTRVPNTLIAEALGSGGIEGIAAATVRREVRVGSSRFDFVVELDPGRCIVEVKNVSLVVDGCARFPDAPTLRGARHLHELAAHAAAGGAAMVIFVIQRADANGFAPNAAADPIFATALAGAQRAGVAVRAYRSAVDLEGMTLLDQVPVRMPAARNQLAG